MKKHLILILLVFCGFLGKAANGVVVNGSQYSNGASVYIPCGEQTVTVAAWSSTAPNITILADTPTMPSGWTRASCGSNCSSYEADVSSGGLLRFKYNSTSSETDWVYVYISRNPINHFINGPNSFCTTATYTFSGSFYTGSPAWASSNPSIMSINSSTGAATAHGSGAVIVSATVTTNCGPFTTSRTIYVGGPTYIMTIDGNQTTSAVVSPGGLYGLNAATQSPGATSYTYTDFSGSGDMSINLVPSGAFSYAVVNSSSTSGHRQIVVQGTNSCGSINQNVYLYLASMFRTYPNPAKSELTLEFLNVQDKKKLPIEVTLFAESSASTVKTVSVWDYFDKKLFKDGNKILLDVSQLRRGTYYLHVRYDQPQEKHTEKIRVILE